MKAISSAKAVALRTAALAFMAGTATPGAAQETAAALRMIPLPDRVPETEFSAKTLGEVWFDSRAPFDFDLLLNHLDEVPEISPFGYLYRPHAASAENPAPASVCPANDQ